MSENYVGVDQFSHNLQLMTDLDQPSAIVFRVPFERLLDNDINLKNRTEDLESANASVRLTNLEQTSNVAALVTTTASITPLFLATKTLNANEATLGQRWRYSAQVQVARGATATATTLFLRIRAGSGAVHTLTKTLNTTNGYTGTFRFEGEISFHAAPSAASAFTVTCLGFNTVASATPEVDLPTPSLVLTDATNAGFVIDIVAGLNAPTAGCSITPICAGIHRIKP